MFRTAFAFALFNAALACAAAPAAAADWMFEQSTFSHNPQTGERVTQYARPAPAFAPNRPDYLESGYRHSTSSIVTPLGADHTHIVEEWGRPVRPYGEWQFPYRPYSVPYPQWGPQFGWGGYFPYAPYGQPYGAGPYGGGPYGNIPFGEAVPQRFRDNNFYDGDRPYHPWYLHPHPGKPEKPPGGGPGHEHPKHDHPKHEHPKHEHGGYKDPGFGAT